MYNINVLQAIESLDFMLEDVNDEEVKKWVSNEINGYSDSNDDMIPNLQKNFMFLSCNELLFCIFYSKI